MADIEPPVGLYDFLYRDLDRIASYYAQMFKGRLISTENNTGQKTSIERTGKIVVAGSGGEIKNTEEEQNSLKEIIDPHDRATTEVLSFLMEGGYINEDITAASNGSLVIQQGTIVYVEKSIFEMAIIAFEAVLAAEKKKPKNQQNQETIMLQEMLSRFLPKVALPSAFLLSNELNKPIVGTIKENGLQEPIASYYFKHGGDGLSDVYVIGVKEIPGTAVSLPSNAFIGIAQEVSKALSSMLFPEDAYRVTPLAIFRKLF